MEDLKFAYDQGVDVLTLAHGDQNDARRARLLELALRGCLLAAHEVLKIEKK